MITGIAHVCFTASDLDRSERFYGEVLGMTPAFDFRDENGRRTGLYLHAGARNFIELFEGQSGQPEGPTSYRHLCLEVAEIEPVVEHVRSKGIEVTDIILGGDGSYQAWLTDPDGNRIEIHCYTAESRQAGALGGG